MWELHKRLRTRRILELVQVEPTEKAAISAAFAEPSDGLEPLTPSLPWRIRAVGRDGGTALATAIFLQLSRFVCLAHLPSKSPESP
jgi:hypothetical protein